LTGQHPGYNFYRTRDGWIALCALEPWYQDTLRKKFQLSEFTVQALGAEFLGKTTAEWVEFAREHDLPISPVNHV
jgi:crotonobetainyl-CoA:carnitine CoA-transferase CaiB-like acyl-CoA transferase